MAALNTQSPSPEHDKMVYCLEFFVQDVSELSGAILSGPSHSPSLEFNSGKSALFQLDETALSRMLTSSPLQVLLLDLSLPRAPKMAGSAAVELAALRREVVLPVAGSPADQRRGFHRGVFPLRDLMGSVLGQVRLVLRLACLGSSLLPHLRLLPQLNRQKAQWVEKGARPSLTAAAAAGSGVAAAPAPPLSTHPLRDLPPHFGQLDPPVRDDTATTWRAQESRRSAHRDRFDVEEKQREEYERGDAPLRAAHVEESQVHQPDGSPQHTQQAQVFPHPHAALHSLESLATTRRQHHEEQKEEDETEAPPAILLPGELDPRRPSSHRPALTLGPAPTARLARHDTLETLTAAIAAELRHHNLDLAASPSPPAGSGSGSGGPDPGFVPGAAMGAYPLIEPRADCYAPPSLFFYRDPRETELASGGVLEVEYRRCIAQEQQQQRQREKEREQAEQRRWEQEERRLDSRPAQLSLGGSGSGSASQPDLLSLAQRGHDAEEERCYTPRSPSARSSLPRGRSSAPGTPRSPSARAAAQAPLSPLTPRRLQQRHPSSGTPVGRSPSPHVKRAESARKLSALERRYRDMEAEIALENLGRAREHRGSIPPAAAAAPAAAGKAAIPPGREPHLSVETRPRRKALPPPRAAEPFSDLAAAIPAPAVAPGLGLEASVAMLDALTRPAPRPRLPGEYGAYRPVPKLKGLPLAAQQDALGAKPYRRAPVLTQQQQQAKQARPRSAAPASSSATVSKKGAKKQGGVGVVGGGMQSTTPFARAFEEVQHLHDQLDSQRDPLREGNSAPGSPMARRTPLSPLSPRSPAGARGRKVQFDVHERWGSPEPRVPSPPSPGSELDWRAGAPGPGARAPWQQEEGAPSAWPNEHAHHGSSYQREAWASLGGLKPRETPPRPRAGQAPPGLRLGVDAADFDALLAGVESKLAARSELLYRARAAAPPEFLSPSHGDGHSQNNQSPVFARRTERQRALDAALGLGIAPRPVCESTLAQVALDYLNSEAPSRGEMSEQLLRRQLRSIHELISAPQGAEAAMLGQQQQQQQQQAVHGSLAEMGRAYAAWCSVRPAPLDPANQAHYQWEENLSLAS